MTDVPERDWKYLRSIHDEMLAMLCSRINRQTIDLLACQTATEYEKYRKLYSHIQKADRIVAECFDDWRRSTLLQRVVSLRRHKVMTQEQFEPFTPGTQECVKAWESC